MRRYFARIQNCGYKLIVNNWVITIGCRKQACPICGGINHSIHRSRIRATERRISNMPLIATRHIVFTVPDYLREYFLSKASLRSLLGIAKRNTEKYFGVLVRVRNQAKGNIHYRLDKPVLASLELFGERGIYNPHVNVVIFEETPSSLRISRDKLAAIKKSYQRALSSLLKQRIDVVDVRYRYHTTPKTVDKGVWYATKPINPKVFQRIQDRELLLLLTARLKRFRFIRFWGQLSNNRYQLQSTERRAA